MLETYRECLQDVFDLPALRGILKGIQTRELDLVEVETASASPFASSLLFDYVATYMYEDDTPPEERRAQALSLDRDLLRELMGVEELRELLDAGAIEQVEASLRLVPRNADELHDLLRRAGPLLDGEHDAGFAETLLRERRAFRARLRGGEALAAVDDAGLLRDAFGVVPPGGVPTVFLEAVPGARIAVLRRFARTHGPFTTAEVAARFGLDPEELEPELHALEQQEALVRGEIRPGGTEREWCDPDVLRRIRRATSRCSGARSSRRSRRPSAASSPSWHGIGRRQTLREALVPLQAVALPVSLWESDVLPRRVPGYRPADLDALCASGDVVWVGAGLDRVALYFREDAPLLGAPPAEAPPEGPAHAALRVALAQGALFWADLLAASGLDTADALAALWDLVWAGEVTNDAWAPLRAARRYESPRPERRPRRFSRARATLPSPTQGRWSTAAQLFAGAPDRRALAELLLERQGIVTRDGVRGEGSAAATARCTPSSARSRRSARAAAATSSRVSAAPSSPSPGAVERLRERGGGEEPQLLVLAAADPAQPYGAALPWPRRAGARAARVAGAWVVLQDGEAVLFVERGGRSLVPSP